MAESDVDDSTSTPTMVASNCGLKWCPTTEWVVLVNSLATANRTIDSSLAESHISIQRLSMWWAVDRTMLKRTMPTQAEEMLIALVSLLISFLSASIHSRAFLMLGNQNNMRLPTQDGWYPAGYFQRYPFLAVYASATRMTGTSTLTMIVCLTLAPLLVSMGVF